MKKQFVLAGLLVVGFANAQTGKVGVNTQSPQATLQISTLRAGSTGVDTSTNTTNEGLLIPKLSKARVASITDGNLVKGTLIFVEGITYSGANAKVSSITSDGFYHYDGSSWVKGVGGVTSSGVSLPSGSANNQVLKWNGTQWLPASDDNTIYTAGSGITLSGTQFSHTAHTGDVTGTTALTISNGAVTSAKIADGTVALADLATNSVDSSKIVDKSIVAADLNQMGATDGQVLKYNAATNSWAPAADANTATTYTAGSGITLSGTQFSHTAHTGDVTGTTALTISNGAVTSAKIADGTVALADLAANSVDSSKIVDGTVALADLATNSVNSSKIADGTVALADLASNSVNSSKIADGTVALADLASNSVDSSKIVDGTIAAVDLSSMGATASGQVLKWNGSQWAPAAESSGETGTFTRNYVDVKTSTYTVTDSDYFVHFTVDIESVNLPAPSNTNKGRTVCLYNEKTKHITLSPQPIGAVQGVQPGQVACFISSGTQWINSNGY